MPELALPGWQSPHILRLQAVAGLAVRQWHSKGFALPPPPGQWLAEVGTALRVGSANADAATESSLTVPQAKALLQRWHVAKSAALGASCTPWCQHCCRERV